jgi:NAD(P)-dependent dehydrogenase (short-subunit alcohol dehydrogenase family)
MKTLENERALVVGGSRGFGAGVVEALVAHGAKVIVLARKPEPLAEIAQRLGVATLAGDASDPDVARKALRDVRPSILVVTAGMPPPLGLIDEQTWESFETTWRGDVKPVLTFVQEAIRLPLPRGSRVLVFSSGAAVRGSPLSGAYAGAKRMVWLIAQYAAGVAAQRELGIRFQTVVPMQMNGDTELGRRGAEGYARMKGVTVEEILAGFGKPLPPRELGEHVATILTDPKWESQVALALKGDFGIRSLDE